MNPLAGRVAAITGAGSGIGRATSQALAARGCHLALLDVSPESLTETAELLRHHDVRVTEHVVDVRDAAALVEVANDVEAAHSACNILVNNAGVTTAGPSARTSPSMPGAPGPTSSPRWGDPAWLPC